MAETEQNREDEHMLYSSRFLFCILAVGGEASQRVSNGIQEKAGVFIRK